MGISFERVGQGRTSPSWRPRGDLRGVAIVSVAASHLARGAQPVQ